MKIDGLVIGSRRNER